MSPDFKRPISKSEFRRRAEIVTIQSAEGVIKALENRKALLIKPIDDEIEFYKEVIEYKKKGGEA